MKKVEILAHHIFGRDQQKYVRGDIVEIDDELVVSFGNRCKVLEEPEPAPKPKKRIRKVKRDED